MDNCYSSPLLFKYLFAAATTAGTLHTNRKNFPLCFKQKLFGNVPRGTASFVYNGNLTVVKWSDNRDVHSISTLYNNQMTRVKHQVDGESVEVPCPEIIDDYNAFMGGVDLGDQALCY